MDSHNVIYTQIAPKLEYICPSTVDSETGEPLAYQRADCTWGTEYLTLKQDIIKHGIKYPVVLAYNDAESAYHAEELFSLRTSSIRVILLFFIPG
jgi:hypothetical protein